MPRIPPRSHRRLWREPPILFQILALMLGSLVVAQFVTLLLTLALPPAPPVQHGMADIVAALRGGSGDHGLVRNVQPGPPDIGGPGWLTSDEARLDLANRLSVPKGDVLLAFYAPLPFAGAAIPPPPAQATPLPPHPVALPSWPGRDTPRLIPAALLLIDPPGGQPGMGFPGMGFPGGMNGGFDQGAQDGQFRSGRIDHSSGDGSRGSAGGRSQPWGGGAQRSSDILRQDQNRTAPQASPADLDRQPVAPIRPPAVGAAGPSAQPRSDAGSDRRPVPAEGFSPDIFDAPTPGMIGIPAVGPAPRPAAPTATAANPRAGQGHTAPDAQTASPPPPASRPAPPVETARAPSRPPVASSSPPHPVPITPRGTALFGLAPAPFVEGDFVAALRLPDGRWSVVQPAPEGFPNAWQRRVMLWFAIALAIVTPMGWLFARHIVRPLRDFTATAERLGRDPFAEQAPLDGPAEIGRAARAFNVMQSRLRSFVGDRTAMIGAISHDLRTPLTRLRFRIEEVEDDMIREGMNDEVNEMEAMIRSVLDFIRDASTPHVRERLDLGHIVEDVAHDAAIVGAPVTVERIAPAPVEVDALGMRRLLGNLVENAVKYGKRARIRLGTEGDAAVAEVLDDGPGVPEDELERAFEPFYRASNAEQSGKSGTGLGLAVCRSIARAHGGDVRLLHSPEGFKAQLRLPLAYGTASLAA